MKKTVRSVKSSCRWAGFIVAVAVLAAGIQSVTAQTSLYVVNAGFELPATGKISGGWDEAGANDVPGWQDMGAAPSNSGIEGSGSGHSGSYAAYCEGGATGAYQITTNTMTWGKKYTLTWWAGSDYLPSDSPQRVAILSAAATNTPFGSCTEESINNSTVPASSAYVQYTNTLIAGNAQVGKYIGMDFANAGSDWMLFDDFALTVQDASSAELMPNITTQPVGASVYAGYPFMLTVSATGPDLTYQWVTDGGSGGALTNMPNATNSTVTVTTASSSSSYVIQFQVIVTNIMGSVTSSVAALTVNPGPPTVNNDIQPSGNGGTVYAFANGSLTFTANFTGSQPMTNQWATSSSYPLTGATNTTLNLTNLQLSVDDGTYQLLATNLVGTAASSAATLTVLADPAAPDASTAYPYDVFTNGPVAYWRFNETLDNSANSVQAYDYSGNNHNATYGSGAYDVTLGYNGPLPSGGYPAGNFPGFESDNGSVTLVNGQANSSLIAPDLNLNTNAVTITAWINPSGAIGGYWGLLMWRGTNGDAAGLSFGSTVSNSVAELGYDWNSNSPSAYNFHSGLFAPLGQWSFVALTITPTNTSIYLYYVDGSSVTHLFKAVQVINNSPEAFSGGTTWIGSDSFSGRNFNGSIDEMAIFNKSLSEAQVQDLFGKGIGVSGFAPEVENATVYPASSVYSGQNVRLSSSVGGTVPLSLQWQSSPDGTTWTDIAGANSSSVLVNPQTVGTVYYQLVASNSIATVSNTPVTVTYNALPATPAAQWTVNYQVTNQYVNYLPGAGIGFYSGRGILGNGGYWNVLPASSGSIGELDSASKLCDDGGTNSGVTLSVLGGMNPFGSATAVQPDFSDVGNLLYQWVTTYNTNNTLRFTGVPNGTYNLCFYGCDGSFGDRGTTFTAHGANGDQTAGTTNASPILPLQQGVNFVVMTNVNAAGGNLYVDILPTSPVPAHNPNGEADFNGAQLQLVSYSTPTAGFSASATNVAVGQVIAFYDLSSPVTNVVWNFGDTDVLSTTNGTQNHGYSTAGTYTVSQTVTGPGGTASVTKMAYITVTAASAPVIGHVGMSGGSLVLGGSGGTAGQQYRILTSTNVALPLAGWMPVWTNVFAPDGSYSYTNSSPTNGAGFFILATP